MTPARRVLGPVRQHTIADVVPGRLFAPSMERCIAYRRSVSEYSNTSFQSDGPEHSQRIRIRLGISSKSAQHLLEQPLHMCTGQAVSIH